MTDLTLKKTVNNCPIIQVIILVTGTFFSYVIAYSRGDVSLYLPFISETGAFSPEKGIFSLCLILGSFIGSIIIFYHFIVIRENPLIQANRLSLLNVGSLFIGLLSMLGLAGVAAFPMTTVFWAHLMFAGIYFVGSAAYFIAISIITYKTEGKSKVFVFRFSLTSAITILLFFLVIIFPISLVKWYRNNDFIPALKQPENEGFTLVFISSILEWSVVLIIITFTLSLLIEQKKHCLVICVSEKHEKPASVVEGLTVKTSWFSRSRNMLKLAV